MKDIRKEVIGLTRSGDILLNSEAMEAPLTEREQELLLAYLVRIAERFKLPGLVLRDSDSAKPQRADRTSHLKSA